MNKALEFINKYIDDGVVIACSGGPDSMALFDVLLKAGVKNIVCAHVNHKVRVESDNEAIMVKEYCLKNNYASNVTFEDTINAVKQIIEILESELVVE